MKNYYEQNVQEAIELARREEAARRNALVDARIRAITQSVPVRKGNRRG